MDSNARHRKLAPWTTAFLCVVPLALAACSSTFDVLPEKMGGLPATAPERAAQPLASPNVYEVRPTREAKPLTEDEQKKLESELVTLREQQKLAANTPPPPPPAKKAAAPARKDLPPVKKAAAKEEKPAKKKQRDPVVPEQKGPVAAPKLIN